MIAGEFVALLAIVTLPEKTPAAAGVNIVSSVADCPGARVKPAVTPLTEYRKLETLTLETVTLELPAFVRVTLKVPLLPSATFPKFTLGALLMRSGVAAIPVPIKETVVGDAEMLLMTETLPDNAAAILGENTILNVDRFPGSIVKGKEMPVIVIPDAFVVACVTMRFDPPSFDMVTD
jgi:hypothetical protein